MSSFLSFIGGGGGTLTYADIDGYLSGTTASVAYYVDFDSGNDSSDGLSWATAKRTESAIDAIIPYYIKHDTVVNFKGTRTWAASQSIISGRRINTGKYFVIAGENDWEVVDDNGGVNYTADVHTTTSTGYTGAAWGSNAYGGYMVQILSGAAANQVRMIRSDHTGTTLYPTTNFTVDPGAATFRIVRPKTTIQATSGFNVTFFLGGFTGEGTLVFQNFYFTGTKLDVNFLGNKLQNDVITECCVHDSIPSFVINYCDAPYIGPSAVDTTSFATRSSTTGTHCGGGFRNTSGVSCTKTGSVTVKSSYIRSLSVTRSSVSITNGNDFNYLLLNSVSESSTSYGIQSNAGYATTRFSNPSGVGLKIMDSQLTMSGACLIQNCSSHGIEMSGASLQMLNAVTGTGNGGAGVYAYYGSTILTTAGTPPTLTGTVGDFAIDSPTVAAGTWAAVEAGAQISSLKEMTTVTNGAGQVQVALFNLSATQTTTYTAKYSEVVLCDPTSGGFTVTIPTPVGHAGIEIAIKIASASGNAITLSAAAGLIDGASSQQLSGGWSSVSLVSDGSNWFVI